ncbi:MAG TPA: hypothetical protein VNG31_00505, partial [Candidatus Baltobacteraceae bacterium]|nr:hypothetical protein [Candidatus Baltobacteraceae bacterium]
GPQQVHNPAQPQVVIYNNNQVAAPVVGVMVAQKSVLTAFLLTFFFGPLGMLYSTVLGAVVMFVASILVAALTFGLGLIVTWPICVIWGTVAASNYNKGLLATGPIQSIQN